MNNAKIIDIKTHDFKAITLYLQMIFLFLLVVFGVITIFFNKDLLYIVYFILSATLVLMAWNNYKFYKKKYMSILYLAFSALTLISGILELI